MIFYNIITNIYQYTINFIFRLFKKDILIIQDDTPSLTLEEREKIALFRLQSLDKKTKPKSKYIKKMTNTQYDQIISDWKN